MVAMLGEEGRLGGFEKKWFLLPNVSEGALALARRCWQGRRANRTASLSAASQRPWPIEAETSRRTQAAARPDVG